MLSIQGWFRPAVFATSCHDHPVFTKLVCRQSYCRLQQALSHGSAGGTTPTWVPVTHVIQHNARFAVFHTSTIDVNDTLANEEQVDDHFSTWLLWDYPPIQGYVVQNFIRLGLHSNAFRTAHSVRVAALAMSPAIPAAISLSPLDASSRRNGMCDHIHRGVTV
jgi:hypothetical protein